MKFCFLLGKSTAETVLILLEAVKEEAFKKNSSIWVVFTFHTYVCVWRHAHTHAHCYNSTSVGWFRTRQWKKFQPPRLLNAAFTWGDPQTTLTTPCQIFLNLWICFCCATEKHVTDVNDYFQLSEMEVTFRITLRNGDPSRQNDSHTVPSKRKFWKTLLCSLEQIFT